ncbi:hypothetical protein [Rufibacter sp. LB8]|uniref:hypothetical protein n=1 Tax=Rufibacter sp. LB8 TaxID=2777781 RepID=UPI00178C6E18|nr:hypothetical protein [Rufibacter sp. LB8]
MNQLFNKFLKKKVLNQEEILNLSVELALEWEQNWNQPIQARLTKKLPSLTAIELDELNRKSKEVLSTGFEIIRTTLGKLTDKGETIKEKDLKADFERELTAFYPWISHANIKSICNQGLYYSWKDGLGECVK